MKGIFNIQIKKWNQTAKVTVFNTYLEEV